MSIINDSSFCVTILKDEISLDIFKKNNYKGFFTFENKKNEIITKEIEIDDIKSVYNVSNNVNLLGSYVEFSFYENIKKFLFFNKIVKSKNKSGFYSTDFYSEYDPYGMLPLNFVKLTKKESEDFFNLNKEKSNNFKDLFL